MSIVSYSKIYAIGHRATHRLFDGPVVIQEKVDGSQFAFAKLGGELHMRSKGAAIHGSEGAPDLFRAACAHVESIAERLPDGHIFRGEVLKGPKHNVLCYDRAPAGNIVLFDVDPNGLQNYVCRGALEDWAATLGLEAVPELYSGVVEGQERLDELKGITSFLGGQQVEGYVVKNYNRFNADGKTLMGKWVSERFKEVHRKYYRAYGKTAKVDIIERIKQAFATEARWRKGVQHLEEDGRLEGSPRDIGLLIGEIKRDVMTECQDELKDMLWEEYRKHIERAVVAGMPEWYKGELERSVFSEDGEE